LRRRILTNGLFAFHPRRLPKFKTKNDLPETTRVKAIELLNARLADCIDLQTQTKQAHWNVKGPNSFALHELVDKINQEVEDYVDEIVERVVQLGGVAEGTARTAAKQSSLAEYPAKAVDGRSHVEALSSALAAFGAAARKGSDQADKQCDLDTAEARGIDAKTFTEPMARGPGCP
jgi:starvation-inducible DNA-binding protein